MALYVLAKSRNNRIITDKYDAPVATGKGWSSIGSDEYRPAINSAAQPNVLCGQRGGVARGVALSLDICHVPDEFRELRQIRESSAIGRVSRFRGDGVNLHRHLHGGHWRRQDNWATTCAKY